MDDNFVWRNDELLKCAGSPSYFIENYFRTRTEYGKFAPVWLDSVKEELIEVMEQEPLVIGRYPRIYGKTTALAGFSLHKALFQGKSVVYSSVNAARRIDFIKQISGSYHLLPDWMQRSQKEGPAGFQFESGGKIDVIPIESSGLWGIKFDYLIFDDVGSARFHIDEFVHMTKSNNAKMSIVGTFKPNNGELGRIWSEARTNPNGWASLPSFNEEWKVKTILSLADEMYSREY